MKRLIALSPEWAEGYRHASGSLAALGEIRPRDCARAARRRADAR